MRRAAPLGKSSNQIGSFRPKILALGTSSVIKFQGKPTSLRLHASLSIVTTSAPSTPLALKPLVQLISFALQKVEYYQEFLRTH